MDRKPLQLTFEMSKARTSRMRAGSLRVKEPVREALKVAIEKCGIERETIAKELSRLVGEDVSIHTVNNWCSNEKGERRVPLEYAAALALITGDPRILDAAMAGLFRILDQDQTAYYDLGVLVAEERTRRKKKRQTLEKIGL